MNNKLTSSRTADIPERIITASRATGMTEQIVITKDTCFENGIIGEKVLSKEVVDKLNLIDKLQQENNDLMNRVKRLEKIINEKL